MYAGGKLAFVGMGELSADSWAGWLKWLVFSAAMVGESISFGTPGSCSVALPEARRVV